MHLRLYIGQAIPPTPVQACLMYLRLYVAQAHAAINRFGSFVQRGYGAWSTNASIGEGNFHWFLQHVSFERGIAIFLPIVSLLGDISLF